MRSLFIIALILSFSAGSVFAQNVVQEKATKEEQKNFLYKWIDKKGIPHVTDDLGNVPKEYRNKVVVLEQAPTQEESVQHPPASSHRGMDQEGLEEERKAEWRERMRDARRNLTRAEERYNELARKRDALLRAWGGPASGRLDTRQEAQQVEAEMKQARREIDEAHNQIENVIPEQARKAGVPPGWLRE